MVYETLDTNKFILDMKKFENAVKNIPLCQIIPLQQNVYPWVYHILKDYINLSESNDIYVKNVMNILENNKISRPIIRCFISYWLVQLEEQKDDNTCSGYRALRSHAVK